ncbi:uncharacterized protein JCM6883_003629 [Sporobolomyces salmoneus]|uniref:uncharacterized protein n=1 Tax=Sporobolomyces salmoneus TaxID=183962 RepID=UPI00316EA5F2
MPASKALTARRKVMMEEDEGGELITQHATSPSKGPVRGTPDSANRRSKSTTANKLQAPPTPPSSAPRQRTASNSSSSSPSKPPPKSPRVLVTLGGRVYRPPTEDEKEVLTKEEIEANLLLSEPVETVEDLQRTRREEKRKAVELEMKREKLANASPSKGKGRLLEFNSSDDEDFKLTSSPTKAARTPTKLSPTKRRPVTPPPRSNPLSDLITSPSPSLGLPFGSPANNASSSSLPPSLTHLLSLHTALERALILHLSIHGSSIASTVSSVHPTSSSACVRMTNLIDLPTLTRMLEASGKRFTENELKKLCWVWEGCGSRDGEEDADDLEVQGNEAGGMGFLITRSRLAKMGKVSSTYGVGISVGVKANPQLPKFELLPPSSPKQGGGGFSATVPPSPSSIGKGRDGMSLVALWTQGKEERRKEVERRLKRWARNAGKEIVESERLNQNELDQDLRWATSTSSHLLRFIPSVELPPLDYAVPAIASTSTPSPKKPSTPSDILSSPTTPRSKSTTDNNLPVVSPKDFVKALLDGRPVKTKSGSTTDRDRARRERIEAKQRAAQPTAYQASLSGLASGGSSPSKRSLKPSKEEPDPVMLTAQEIYKQRAMLSRLGSIADVVAMRCGTRPTRFDDVCTAVSNSPLLSIGFEEADESLTFLAKRFPDFCYIKYVGGGSTSTSSSGGSLLSTRGGERWIVLTGNQKPKEVKEIVRDELNQTEKKR